MEDLVNYGLQFDKQDMIREIKLKIKQAFNNTDFQQYDPDIVKTAAHRIDNWDFESRFPGAQPISFGLENLKTIQMQQTLVCEKTDGVRFLFLEILIGA